MNQNNAKVEIYGQQWDIVLQISIRNVIHTQGLKKC